MTLFTMLLVLIAERLFKLGEHWQLDHRLEVLFRRIRHFSMFHTLGMTALAMLATFLVLRALYGLFYNVPLLVVWILLGLLCIGAGKVRLHYHAYLKAAARDDAHARGAMASELTMIHGVPPDCDEREFLRELQNALLWINFRFYLAPLFWFIVGGTWGPVTLVGYAFLRAWQSWLARYMTPPQRHQSGIDAILHVLDWIPVRLVGVVYALIGHGEKALPAWFASLYDRHTSQYQVLTRLAQYSLAREPHLDRVETPKVAVSMAKKTSFVVVVVVALLTIYGTLV
ncbi:MULTISPECIES: beta-lactamase regulator AmpE [unclassified Enterobacter]|uniref:beta-lactamase regulator AmpE n=1 Tax=unclassified Enterobacter TaxID=2608935 RepID=UPI0009336775|nr:MULTISPECIES: beta-lactamase regulator AmpE [unclassified Enterobacter]WJD50977.1 beta-lactamase regulator AmpE [Enterobacter sp. PGRG2]